MSPNLRDVILRNLAKLPTKSTFRVHVLITAPKKHNGLYPFAEPRPKCLMQDILVLLSESTAQAVQPIFVAAVDASVYFFPATRCALLHISKVDTTGQGATKSTASTLVKSIIYYYSDPETRHPGISTVWVHLFARAQGQYLFPNSSEHPAKHPLSDAKLCAWWRNQLGQIAKELNESSSTTVLPMYLLPGQSEIEADRLLNFASPSRVPAAMKWRYGHPYAQKIVPLPCSSDAFDSIALLIPSFDDDPKTRFMDEIAYTTDESGVRSPRKKRRRLDATAAKTESSSDQLDDSRDRFPELRKVAIEEFWERMSFRQECVAGALTGFFVLGIHDTSPHTRDDDHSHDSDMSQLGTIPTQMAKRVMTSLLTGHEFSSTDRSIRATATLESMIKGLFETVDDQTPDVVVERTPPPAAPRTPTKATKRLPLDEEHDSRIEKNHPHLTPDTYNDFIYGSVIVDNDVIDTVPAEITEIKPVTVLAVRKKKKN